MRQLFTRRLPTVIRLMAPAVFMGVEVEVIIALADTDEPERAGLTGFIKSKGTKHDIYHKDIPGFSFTPERHQAHAVGFGGAFFYRSKI